jgi:hypothetical protein
MRRKEMLRPFSKTAGRNDLLEQIAIADGSLPVWPSNKTTKSREVKRRASHTERTTNVRMKLRVM